MRKIFSLRFLFASLLALATLVTLASAQSAYVIAYNEATAPLLPLIKAIYAEIGIHPLFELVPSERAIALTSSGYYDADMSRVEGVVNNYPNIVHTNEAIKNTELYAFVKKGSAIVIKLDTLKSHTVGLIHGSKLAEEFLQKQGGEAITSNTAGSLYKMLAAGRFDIALITSTQLMAQADQIPPGIERAGPVLARSMSYHVLNKKHAGLIPKFDAILKEMKSDGRLSKYLDQNK